MDGAMNTPGIFSPRLLIDISYFLTACLFILGLKRMSSPVTARSGIVWAGAGMVVATLVSFLYPGMSNYELIIAAIVVGSIVAWWSGKKVAMTDMPQMIALYNGMGGGAAAAIAAVELYRAAYANEAGEAVHHSTVVMALAVIGGIIGAISFSGSLIAWAKLRASSTRRCASAARSSSTACCSWVHSRWASSWFCTTAPIRCMYR